MTHDEKVEHFRAELRARGMWESNAITPLVRLLWKLGVEVPPPYFLSFRDRALLFGSSFGLLLALVLGLLTWRAGSPALAVALGAAAVGGAIFGVLLAAFGESAKQKLDLPPWSQYPPG